MKMYNNNKYNAFISPRGQIVHVVIFWVNLL